MGNSLLVRSVRAGVVWLWDWSIEHWPTIAIVVSGGVMAYVTSVTAWVREYGPLAWGAVALLTILLLVACYFLYGTAREKIERSRYIALQSKPADSVNALEKHFEKKRIKIHDFIDPFSREVVDKVFVDCDLIGPANIIFEDSFLKGISLVDCDCVLVNKKEAKAFTVSRFKDVTITGGRIIKVTLFVTLPGKTSMGDFGNTANWLNE